MLVLVIIAIISSPTNCPVELQGLIVLEYLVAHGSERVIDDIKEHSYQISVSYAIFYLFKIIL